MFELALHYVEVPGSQGPTPARGRLTPLTVRVVVDETTGDATLTRRRVLIALLTFPLLLPPYIKVWALRGDRHIDQRAGAPRPPYLPPRKGPGRKPQLIYELKGEATLSGLIAGLISAFGGGPKGLPPRIFISKRGMINRILGQRQNHRRSWLGQRRRKMAQSLRLKGK